MSAADGGADRGAADGGAAGRGAAGAADRGAVGAAGDALRIGADVAWTSDAARVVALDLVDPAATPFALENSAAVVWEQIAEAEEITLEALLRELYDTFDGDRALIRADVERLVEDLVARNLLVRSASA